MSTTSYYPCPRCHGILSLTEHYYPRQSEMGPLSLEFVVLDCPKCNGSGKGIDELEAYTKLQENLSAGK